VTVTQGRGLSRETPALLAGSRQSAPPGSRFPLAIASGDEYPVRGRRPTDDWERPEARGGGTAGREGRFGVTARIKIDLEHLVRCGEPIVLDLGCGARKGGGRIGIDKLDLPSVDIVADVEEGLPFLADNSVDEIHAKSFLEHVRNFELLMTEIVRVLKPGGRAHVFVPHFSNPYYYSDYTHIRFFGLYTFQYFVNQEHQLRRGVPNFYTTVRIRVLSQELVFMSPFKRRHRVKKLLGFLVNLHRATQEFYEENLCYIFPCYGLKIIFTPDKVPA